MDQLEVAGRRYERSIGIQLDPLPAAAMPNGNIIVSGNITNYGAETRKLVAIGLRDSSLAGHAPFRTVLTLSDQPGTPPSAPFQAVSGSFDLSPAGTAGSTKEFRFNVGLGPSGETYQIALDVLEAVVAGAAISYRMVDDDVPGRAHVVRSIRTLSLAAGEITDVRFSPSALPAPGPVVVEGTGRNTGTEPLNVTVHARVTLPNGTDLATLEASVGHVKPGQPYAFRMPPVDLPVSGNYTLRVNGTGTPHFWTYYRVHRSDVNLSASFDNGWGGWGMDNATWVLATDDAAFYNASVLFGLNNTAYYDSRLRLEGGFGNLTSPPLELRHTTANRTLTFWHKPMMTSGNVRVLVELLTADLEPRAGCSGNGALLLASLTGRQDRWQNVTLPLGGWQGCDLNTSAFRIRFYADQVTGQGWRLDGVTLGSGALELRQAVARYPITDSASKEYPLVVRNPGHVPKEVVLGIDPLLSRVSPAQMQWLSVTPRVLRIEPGASATATLRVETPAARGAFPQGLDVVLSATDLAAPFAPAGLRLNLDFRPLPRQDLSVAASADGKPLGGARVDLEEAVPHEVSVVITNQGVEESGPTDVRMEILDDATGRTLWTQTRAIPALGPYTETEESFIVSGAWKPAFGARGNHTLRVVVDPERRFVDYDRSNDDVRIPLNVVRLVRPDLSIDARGFGVTTPGGVPVYEAVPGQLVRIAAAVTNDGYADARDVTLRLLAGASVLKEEFVPLLRPGETHVIRANQFAPNASVTYRVLAFTPDLELLSENNERSVELPVFPAEVRIEAEPLDDAEPGATRLVNVTIVDDGPYPLALRLEARSGGPLARLDRSQVALAPGESARMPLRVTVAPDERAGVHLVVLRALDGDVVRAQRTIPMNVAERPAAVVLPHVARGPPEALLVQLD
ncbi:MAG TPA: CARDB domain-containing protein, partial [Candidatus Thermoplasmatota archaeon]|nr:CARDB domain-containing protein [Candidatus Thermoplasmatota archaeon]